MRITIVENEIKEAIIAHIQNQLTIKDGQEISVDFKATRGEDGATAEINIVAATAPVVATPVRRGRPPAVKEPQEAAENASTAQTVEDTSADENATVEASMEESGPVEAGLTEPEVQVAADNATEEAPVEATAAPKTGSLFNQLKRPTNA